MILSIHSNIFQVQDARLVNVKQYAFHINNMSANQHIVCHVLAKLL